MARIGGVNLPTEKQVLFALTYIHGIGRKTSEDILSKSNIDQTIRIKDLTDADIKKISDIIRNDYTVEGELQRVTRTNIKRLVDIGTYRGARHKSKLPTRGQRTRTNARTKRGRKIAIGGAQPKSATKT